MMELTDKQFDLIVDSILEDLEYEGDYKQEYGAVVGYLPYAAADRVKRHIEEVLE